METTVVYWGYIGDNGKENGNYYNGESNGKENGNEMETREYVGVIISEGSFRQVQNTTAASLPKIKLDCITLNFEV